MFIFLNIIGTIMTIISSLMNIVTIICTFIFITLLPKVLKLVSSIIKRIFKKKDNTVQTQTKPNIKREDIDRCQW